MTDTEFLADIRTLPCDEGGYWVEQTDLDRLIILAMQGLVLKRPKVYKSYKDLPHEYIRSLFSYDPETGIFTRKETGENAVIGAGQGYFALKFSGFSVHAHRMAWFLVNGEWPEKEIDHINRNRSDNRYWNLRLATRAENCANVTKHRDGKTPYKGIYAHGKRWAAALTHNGKRKHLGTYDTPEEAKKIYDAAVIEHRGNLYVE